MGLPSFDARALSENRLCGQIAPPSIASTTHLRKSSEYGFAIHTGLLPVGSLNHIRAGMGIPDSAFSGKALKPYDPELHDALVAWSDRPELPHVEHPYPRQSN